MEKDRAELAKWVKKAQKGEASAFGHLIERTQNRLFKFCFYLCGNRELAQEITQDTYLKALSKITSLDKPEAFVDWLYRIARNQFLDQVRSQSKDEISLDLETSPGLDLPLERSDLDQVLAVRTALSQLETEDRLVILLVDMEQYSYQEAAEIIGISEDALRSRLHRARQVFLLKWKKSETKCS